jgi:hypothetical protein
MAGTIADNDTERSCPTEVQCGWDSVNSSISEWIKNKFMW